MPGRTLALLRRPRALSMRAALMVVVGLAFMAMVSVATAEIIGTKNAGHLTAVGPVSETDGFPVWYKDDTNTKLEFCLDKDNPLCGFLPGDVPDETKPVSFPDNWPEEIFYFLAGSDVTAPGGGSIVATLGLEATFANGAVVDGDQMVFGRVRFVGKGLQPGATYTITHPYGVDRFTAADDGSIKFTEDIGISPGRFGEALNSRIGPFLRWDPAVAPAAPQGYVGDPTVEHAVTGSPFDTNFLKACVTPAGGAETCAQNDQFTVQGKISTNGGVEPTRATYSRDAATGSTLDVFATSDLGAQSLEVSGDGFDATRLRGENGNYMAHVDFTGDVPPASVKVSNVGDTPVSSKTIPVTDGVEGHATYNADTSELVVNATSTDTVGAPTLTAKGFGAIVDGTGTFANIAGPPASVTVTSSAGGSADLPVDVTGAGFPAIPVQAFAGTDQQVLQGQTVTLDGSASTGPVKSYSWAQAAGDSHQVQLSGADTAQPTFTAPALAADEEATLNFELTVDGAGGPSKDTVSVLVKGSAPAAAANAGPDQTVDQNSVVTLDASGSADATKFAWKQVDGPATVTLTGDTTAQPTFRAPKVAGTFTFEVSATGPGGSSTDQVQVTTRPDVLSTTTVQFRRGEWRIDGASTVAGPGVTVKITVAGTGQLVANAGVDTLGAFRYRGGGPTVANGARVDLESSSGGKLTVPVTVRN